MPASAAAPANPSHRNTIHTDDEPAVIRRILIVDANSERAASLAVRLRAWRHLVQVVDTGPATLEAADAFRPEVVLLRLDLVGMDALEAARRLRPLRALKDTLLVALSDWLQEEDRRRCSEAGFDAHLPTPIDPDHLRQLLAHPRLPSNSLA